MLIFQLLEMYCLFVRRKISLSKFSSCNLLRHPLVASPQIRSTAALEAGVDGRSKAILDKNGNTFKWIFLEFFPIYSHTRIQIHFLLLFWNCMGTRSVIISICCFNNLLNRFKCLKCLVGDSCPLAVGWLASDRCSGWVCSSSMLVVVLDWVRSVISLSKYSLASNSYWSSNTPL